MSLWFLNQSFDDPTFFLPNVVTGPPKVLKETSFGSFNFVALSYEASYFLQF
jgi:hypothetical protein